MSAPIIWDPHKCPPPLREALKTLAEEYPLYPAPEKGIHISFEETADAPTCTITRQGQSARIRYPRPASALRAVGALLSDLVPDGASLEERAPFSSFGIMLDCSRNAVMQPDHNAVLADSDDLADASALLLGGGMSGHDRNEQDGD